MPPVNKRGKWVVAISSGKGGVGKTGLAVNIASFCSSFSKKVLLVDCDLCTRGATVFFHTGKYEPQKRIEPGKRESFDRILAIACGMQAVTAPFSPSRFHIGQSLFDFIPANADAPLYGSDDLHDLGKIDEEFLRHVFHNYKNNYDIIILDLQAGNHKLNQKLMKIADQVILVLEDDRISKSTINSVFGSFLGKIQDRLFYCVNKWKESNVTYLNIENQTILGISYSENYAASYRDGKLIEINECKQCMELAKLVSNLGENGSLSSMAYNRNVDAKAKDKKMIKKEARRRLAVLCSLIVVLISIIYLNISVVCESVLRILLSVLGIIIVICILLLFSKKKTVRTSCNWFGSSLSNLSHIDSWAIQSFLQIEPLSVSEEKKYINSHISWN